LEYFLHNDRSQTFSREFLRNLKKPELVVTTITNL